MPDRLGIEREKEFHCGACKKGGEDGIYTAMNMVKWKDM